jgi:hypothetical protein
MYVEAGTVGWYDDAEYYETATGADGQSVALVKVQLYRGRPAWDDVSDRGRGYPVKVRVNGWPIWSVPPKGTEVLVAFPGGDADTPGNGVIIACPSDNPPNQFGRTQVKFDPGKEHSVVIKGKKVTVTMHAPTGTGTEDFFSINPESGLQIIDKSGNGLIIKDGNISVHLVDASKAVDTAIMLTSKAINFVTEKAVRLSLTKALAAISGNEFTALAGRIALGAGAALPVMTGSYSPSTSVYVQA